MKKVIVIISVIVGVLLLAGGGFCLYCFVQVQSMFTEPEAIEPLAFDRATWDSANDFETWDNPKHRMALSLMQNETLIGKPEADIRQMLGEPMYTIDNWPTKGARQLQYGVGPSTSLIGLDFTALFVELSSPAGVVTRVTIGRRNI
jgi:hypothetical protein